MGFKNTDSQITLLRGYIIFYDDCFIKLIPVDDRVSTTIAINPLALLKNENSEIISFQDHVTCYNKHFTELLTKVLKRRQCTYAIKEQISFVYSFASLGDVLFQKFYRIVNIEMRVHPNFNHTIRNDIFCV